MRHELSENIQFVNITYKRIMKNTFKLQNFFINDVFEK